jgi:predicted nucleic acid-binding protein
VTPNYLLDTSVISLLAPERPRLSGDLTKWIESRQDNLLLSAITILEIEQGINKLVRAGGTARAERLTNWLNAILDDFGDRILVVDVDIARVAGAMSDAAIAKGEHPGLADVLIAATAKARSAIVLTRNGRHFAALGVGFADPLERLP